MIHFILVSGTITISLYLMTILISFDPADPSWLQITTWHGFIHNFGGIIGARFSDFLFFVFGILAYSIPFLILLYLWRIYIQVAHITFFTIFCELIGLLVLLFICCGLLNLIIGDFFYFSSGGIIGSILCDWIFSDDNSIYRVGWVLFLIGIINVIFFFNQFFIIIKNFSKKKLFNLINTLTVFFYKIKKIKYQSIHCKLHNQSRVCPTVIVKKELNYLKYSTHKFFKKKQFFNTSIDTNRFSKKFNCDLKNNYITKIHINLSNILKKKNHSSIKQPLSYYNTAINYMNYGNYQKKIDKINYLKKNNFLNFTNLYNQETCRNNKLCISKNKGFKNNNFLIKKFNSTHVFNNKNVKSQFISAKKNIKRHSFITDKISIAKKNDVIYNGAKDIIYPDINLLIESIEKNVTKDLELKKISQLLEKKLEEYRIITNVANIVPGPVITRFELNLSPGIKSSRIVSLSRDLARSLSVVSLRVVEVIPGTPYVGLEIPNQKRKMVYLRDIISSEKFRKINTPLALALGQDISGNPIIKDLRRMPHLLVAGTTGSGKSVAINTMIVSILYKANPDEVRFIMIDPKILELSIYSNIPHILNKVVTEVKDVDKTLQWCVQEMERRYQLMAIFGVRNLENYNYYVEQLYSEKCKKDDLIEKLNSISIINFGKKFKKLPYIVIIVDEFSDLMIVSTKKIEELIIRLTQKARAAGIHLILATQRPSVNVITGLIKANIPARIAFTVSSKIDSHTIIGQSGAESLLGMGDMLYLSPNSSIPIRIHGACIQDKEIYGVVNFWKTQKSNI